MGSERFSPPRRHQNKPEDTPALAAVQVCPSSFSRGAPEASSKQIHRTHRASYVYVVAYVYVESAVAVYGIGEATAF